VTTILTPVLLSQYGHHAGFRAESATGRQTRAQRFDGPYRQRALHNGRTLWVARAGARRGLPRGQTAIGRAMSVLIGFSAESEIEPLASVPESALAIAEQRDQAARMYREGEVLMAVAVEVAHLHVAIVVREWWKPGFAPA
jgi:hypothetical protein